MVGYPATKKKLGRRRRPEKKLGRRRRPEKIRKFGLGRRRRPVWSAQRAPRAQASDFARVSIARLTTPTTPIRRALWVEKSEFQNIRHDWGKTNTVISDLYFFEENFHFAIFKGLNITCAEGAALTSKHPLPRSWVCKRRPGDHKRTSKSIKKVGQKIDPNTTF